jgi:hypothetical protein
VIVKLLVELELAVVVVVGLLEFVVEKLRLEAVDVEVVVVIGIRVVVVTQLLH